MARSLLTATGVVLAFASAAHAQRPETREFVSYVWTSGIDGRVGIGDRAADVASPFHDLIDFVDVGGSVHYSSTSDRFGWFLDGTYLRLSDNLEPAQGGGKAEVVRRIGEIAVTRALAPKLTGYLGVRSQQLDSELRLADGRVFSDDSTWTDGIVGARWTPIQSAAWTAWLRADIGAGGSDSVWLGELGGGYRFGSSWTAYVAYKVLDTDYSGNGLLYDVRESGLAFGFGFTF